jgi:hypothetical protein
MEVAKLFGALVFRTNEGKLWEGLLLEVFFLIKLYTVKECTELAKS